MLTSRLKSIRCAAAGIVGMLKNEPNARLHAVASVAVIAAGFALRVDASDWAVLSVAVALVWVAEAFNTAIERLADVVSPEVNPLVRDAKDVAAGAVLIAALASVVIGAFAFVPHLLELLHS